MIEADPVHAHNPQRSDPQALFAACQSFSHLIWPVTTIRQGAEELHMWGLQMYHGRF